MWVEEKMDGCFSYDICKLVYTLMAFVEIYHTKKKLYNISVIYFSKFLLLFFMPL